jgi:hypothetical protein
VDGQNLDILVETTAVDLLVLDAEIGKVHLLVEVRQVVLARPKGDLVRAAIWMAVVVVALSIALVQPPLVFALELVVEDHSVDPRAAQVQALSDVAVRRMDLRVVFDLARAFQPA